MASDRLQTLEQKLGHVFADRSLLQTALTHASVPGAAANYERLEFLGDRVLGLVVAELLYKAFPAASEGDLAKRHTALVQQAALLMVAEKIELSSFLQVSPGEQKTGGAQKDTIVADALEAVIAAIYLDGGLAAGAAFIGRFWQSLLHAQIETPQDPKTLLQEWAQSKGLPLPDYVIVGKAGSDHAPVFDVAVRVDGHGETTGRGATKRQAEKEAAMAMLEKIQGKSA